MIYPDAAFPKSGGQTNVFLLSSLFCYASRLWVKKRLSGRRKTTLRKLIRACDLMFMLPFSVFLWLIVTVCLFVCHWCLRFGYTFVSACTVKLLLYCDCISIFASAHVYATMDFTSTQAMLAPPKQKQSISLIMHAVSLSFFPLPLFGVLWPRPRLRFSPTPVMASRWTTEPQVCQWAPMAPSTRFLVGHLRHIFLIAESGDSTAPLRNERMDKFVYCGICLYSTEVRMWKESGFVLVEGGTVKRPFYA